MHFHLAPHLSVALRRADTMNDRKRASVHCPPFLGRAMSVRFRPLPLVAFLIVRNFVKSIRDTPGNSLLALRWAKNTPQASQGD